MIRVLKKVIIPHCSRDAKVLYVQLQNVWNHNKITFLKKSTKKRPKKVFKKELLHKILIYLF